MGWSSRVLWSEGMFLQPQHFQQQDRFFQQQLTRCCSESQPFAWGLTELQLDEALLALGKVSLLHCRGIFPDGTPFSLPEDQEPPQPLLIEKGVSNAILVLALPEKRPGMPEASEDCARLARYRPADYLVRNSHEEDEELVNVQVGVLHLKLALQHELSGAWCVLGLARIRERQADGRLLLDNDYIPACLSSTVSARLRSSLTEVVGLLRQRGELLAKQLGQPGASGISEVVDFLLLQLINQQQPLFEHLASLTILHPELFYRHLLQLAGALSAFSAGDKRPESFPVYQHDDLQESLSIVMQAVRQSLTMVLTQQAVSIPLEPRQYGVHLAILHDKSLLDHARFIIAVQAEIPEESVRKGFPLRAKLSPAEHIRDLVNLQLPGISLRPLAAVPRQLPFYDGFCYFELEPSTEQWAAMAASAGFALHVPADFPGLQMALWALRNKP
ncbi:type VI secretion system baseplate subunit TssK [Chromobacterium haemolyticum]|uniref:Type VI secretion system-associated protein n=1 Tax=Chromobacterium haemolyticum TaxID=394935 RepID=A0A1W0CDU9_9NEIS|nr:type VI secretion system baseplate subunit TssK [Chromobacterium haemolyticum]OQS32960.1 type VI secretion system-associated protein [Chromobacterium haemolyticum]